MIQRLARICRHPIKGHGREQLASVLLSAGACLPYDRHWAVAHEAARLTEGWNPCQNFCRGAKAPALMALSCALDEATGRITLTLPDRGSHSFRPDVTEDHPAFLEWIAPLIPPERARPTRIITAERGMTDSEFPSVSILSLSSLADLSARMGKMLSVDRWRGNLWLEGAAPWTEFDWIGREIRIGGATLLIRERITRCRATTVDPETGKIDGDTLAGLETSYGHQDFGVYASVISGGPIAVGDEWSLT